MMSFNIITTVRAIKRSEFVQSRLIREEQNRYIIIGKTFDQLFK